VGSEGFPRFPSPHSLVGSDEFVPKSIVPTVKAIINNFFIRYMYIMQSWYQHCCHVWLTLDNPGTYTTYLSYNSCMIQNICKNAHASRPTSPLFTHIN